jgi:hypothetical protein
MSLISDVFSHPVHFEFFASSLTVYILPICLPVKETAEIETGRQKSPAGTRQTYGKKLSLVCLNRKKISQIIKDYFYLPFFLLIILCGKDSDPPNVLTEFWNSVFDCCLWYDK